ncbi:glycosyltransferase family 2 protein [Aerococcus viridans]|uniref:glycosyltransferase family 2 protein n=1 Tax=Aerococcus viridans TaxID=1377 RepID=UPI003B21170B
MNKVTPLVSVIIPFFSGKDWLEEALKSVFNQTYKNLEVILVNDGSVENIDAILECYSGKIKYFYQDNKGASSARNTGIDLAEGEYIAFLDSDDIWDSNKTRIQVSLMIKYDYKWSHTNYRTFDSSAKIKKVQTSHFYGYIYPLSFIYNPIATPTVIIKKELLNNQKELRFPEGIKYGEDTIFWGLLSKRVPLLAVEEELVSVRLRGVNSSKVAKSQINGRANIWKFIKGKKIQDTFNLYVKLAYSYCIQIDNLFERYPKLSKSEIINRIIYFIPWFIFKIEKKKYLELSKDLRR